MKRPNSNFVVLGLSGCMLVMSLAEAPAAGRRVISLDGTWQLAEGQADRRPAPFDRKVPVPGLADLAQPAFAPVGLMVDFTKERILAGSKPTQIPVVVINDLEQPWQGPVILRLKCGGRMEAELRQECHLEPWGQSTLNFEMRWPTQPGPCTLEAELAGVDGKPVRSLRDTEIADAKSNMTITAASGARQNLIGMGSTSAVPHNYSRLPLDSRLDMARMVWDHDGLGFRVCKLWADQRWAPNGAQMLSRYKSLYDDINSVQTNMIWMYGATGNAQRDGLENYAAHHAQMVADCKAGGMVFQYVGTCNEPNGSNPYLYWPSNAAALVKDFRAELDKRGLQNVKMPPQQNLWVVSGSGSRPNV